MSCRAEDEKGLDEKVLAVPDKDPRFNHMTSLRDVPEHVLREITNFFEVSWPCPPPSTPATFVVTRVSIHD